MVIINLHSNVILDNDTSFNRYYQKIRKDIKTTYHQLYGFEIPRYFYVRVWNADHLQNKTVYSNAKMTQFRNNINSLRTLLNRSYSTKCYDSLTNITPLKKLAINPKPFYTMDIETINDNGNQKPFIISFSSSLSLAALSEVFYNKDLNLLWQDFFTFIFSKLTNKVNTIFVHNLGGFDGIFLHKYICNTFPDSETIIDESNKYILIKIKYLNRSYIFKDSLRLFPVSLNDLCKVFNVEGKVQDYNMDWNDITILDSPTDLELLLTYARQDSVILLKALTKAQQEFLSKYGVDIVDVLSLPSLALKIFRLKYLKFNIPVLNRINDDYIRRSYFSLAEWSCRYLSS